MELKLRTLIAMLCIACVQNVCAQITLEELQANESKYYHGLGYADTFEKASEDALGSLISQISTTVSSRFESVVHNDSVKMKAIMKTYSNMTLQNVRQLLVSDKNGQYVVARYVLANDVEKVFEKRKSKILEYLFSGINYENHNNIGSAIHNYYWALMLLRSYPNSDALVLGDVQTSTNYLSLSTTNVRNEVKAMVDREGAGSHLSHWIAEKIGKMIKSLSWSISEVENDDNLKIVSIDVRYNGAAVNDFNYTYFDGRSMSTVCELADGHGTLEIPGSYNEKKVKIYVDYLGKMEANHDSELANVLENTERYHVPNTDIMMAKAPTPNPTPTPIPGSVSRNTLKTDGIAKLLPTDSVQYLKLDEAEPYLKTYDKVLTALRSKQYNSIKNLFTDEGWDMFTRLIHYGNARVIGNPEVKFLNHKGDVTCRSIPMSFTFKSNNHRTFTENVVLHINTDQKITAVAFALEKQAADDIFYHKGNWGDDIKQTLVNFLETYKTAYALERIDYLKSIFSDNALIITGSILKVKDTRDVRFGKDIVKYTKQTKDQYMRNLERCFKSNEFVNIKFSENVVKKGGLRENNNQEGRQLDVFGIQVKQDYYSSSYGDTGYLFLLVDMEDDNHPVIHVRTWQPEKDSKFANGRIGINDEWSL